MWPTGLNMQLGLVALQNWTTGTPPSKSAGSFSTTSPEFSSIPTSATTGLPVSVSGGSSRG